MNEARLLSIFFLLGKSPRELEFLEEDWKEEFQDSTELGWDDFISLHKQGLWELNEQAIDLFSMSFSTFEGYERVKLTFESITADTEDWNDYLELLINSDDFEIAWSDSWLTRFEMESSLAEFSSTNSDSPRKIAELKDQFERWFDSASRNVFRTNLINLLYPLTVEVRNTDAK